MLTDSIADFLTRLRNANRARKDRVTVRSSRMGKAITQILADKQFIEKFEETTRDNVKELTIIFKTGRNPLELKRISKPGQRIYIGHQNIKRVRNGLGIGIISTSQGLKPDAEAKKLKIGGEYICEIY